VLKGPSNYDDIPRGTARRNLVLDRMHERGFIADAEWQAARTEALILRPAP
jgi:membrane peptidoglycan carboxypeptidase